MSTHAFPTLSKASLAWQLVTHDFLSNEMYLSFASAGSQAAKQNLFELVEER